MPETRFLITRIANGEVQELTWAVPVGREVDGVKLVKDGSSRKHAVLTLEDGSVYLEDLLSAGGTYVNSAKITRKVRLSSGDRLTFDLEEFEFRVQALVHGAGAARRQKPPAAWANVDWDTRLRDGTERLTRDELNEYHRRSTERLANLKTQKVSIPCLVPSSGAAAAAGRTQKIFLLTVNDQGVQEWLIGRHTDSTIRFSDKSVSECHAKIVREGQKWKLLDAIASNGCYVNDLQIGMAYLSSGDRSCDSAPSSVCSTCPRCNGSRSPSGSSAARGFGSWSSWRCCLQLRWARSCTVFVSPEPGSDGRTPSRMRGGREVQGRGILHRTDDDRGGGSGVGDVDVLGLQRQVVGEVVGLVEVDDRHDRCDRRAVGHEGTQDPVAETRAADGR
jgi:pSer/pThr/pTyr-binding forkhead associated (FHA) protein